MADLAARDQTRHDISLFRLARFEETVKSRESRAKTIPVLAAVVVISVSAHGQQSDPVVELMKELTSADGPSGFEGPVRWIFEREMRAAGACGCAASGDSVADRKAVGDDGITGAAPMPSLLNVACSPWLRSKLRNVNRLAGNTTDWRAACGSPLPSSEGGGTGITRSLLTLCRSQALGAKV